MENNYQKQGRWLITKFFLGSVFSILLLLSLALTVSLALIIGLAFLGVLLGSGGGSIPNTDSLGKVLAFCIAYCWNAIGDCVEDKAIGTNMKQEEKEDETGWFLRVLNEQANRDQSLAIKITKGIFGILIALVCLTGSGFAGYLFFNALMSGTLVLNLGLLLSLGATVGLGFGVLLMFAEIYKIVKSVQKYYCDTKIKEYLGRFNQNQKQENSVYKQAEIKFDQMVKENKISDFIEEKTSNKNNGNIEVLTQLFSDKHKKVKLDKNDKIKIFVLINKFGVDDSNSKKQINEIINSYRK